MKLTSLARSCSILGLLLSVACQTSRQMAGPNGPNGHDGHDGTKPPSPEFLRSWDVMEGKAFSVYGSELGPHVMVHIGINPNAGQLITNKEGKAVLAHYYFYPRVPAVAAEDQIQWVVMDESLVEGRSDHFWRTFDVDYRPRDLALLEQGHVLVLGEATNGETLIESWRLAMAPGMQASGAPWNRVHGAQCATSPITVRSVDGELDLVNPRWKVSRGEVWRADLGAPPVLLASAQEGELLFVLTQNMTSGRATLRQLKPNQDWAESILISSDEQPMLKACDSLKIMNADSDGGFDLVACSIKSLAERNAPHPGCLRFRWRADSGEVGAMKAFSNLLHLYDDLE